MKLLSSLLRIALIFTAPFAGAIATASCSHLLLVKTESHAQSHGAPTAQLLFGLVAGLVLASGLVMGNRNLMRRSGWFVGALMALLLISELLSGTLAVSSMAIYLPMAAWCLLFLLLGSEVLSPKNQTHNS